MKTWKRLICWAVCLIMVGALAVSVAPVEANAAAANKVRVCGAMDGNNDVVDTSPGIPIALSDGVWVFTKKGLYTGSGNRYLMAANDGVIDMQYLSSDSNFDVFVLDGEASYGYKAAQAVVGSNVTLHALKGSSQVSGTGKITGYNSTANSEGFYDLELDVTSDLECMVPIAVVDGSGNVVAILNNSGAFAFAEPKSSGGSAPKETQPAPQETQPAPKETQPAPKETQPAPQETQPAPTEAAPAPDGPARETEATEPVPGPEPGTNTGLIIGIAAAVVVAVVVILLVAKKKKKAVPVVVDLPETMPVKPAPRTEPNNWETVPAPSGIRVYIAGVDGALRGLEYLISERGITIGRAEDASVRYPADTKGVSRRHCKIFWNNGVLMVMDLGSTSGTFLRGKGQLPPNAPVAIVEGDVIYLGSKQNAMVIRTK